MQYRKFNGTVPRRQLGRVWRRLRVQAVVILDDAAEALQYAMWRIESGLAPVRVLDAKAMCHVYQATPDMVEMVKGLAAETRTKGWWHAYGEAIPTWFEVYGGMKAAACRIRQYDETLIPGLLQTRGYASEVYRRRSGMNDTDRDRAVQIRLRRQSLLTRRIPDPPQLDVILSEAVLLRAVGGRATMVNQLRHLLAVAKLPTVKVRVLPLSVGAHSGAVAGTFVLLSFPATRQATPEPPVVYIESLTGSLYLDRPHELAAYERVWAGLEELALDEGHSRELIEKIIREVHRG